MKANFSENNIKNIVYQNKEGLKFQIEIDNGEIIDIKNLNDSYSKNVNEEETKDLSIKDLIDRSKSFWESMGRFEQENKDDTICSKINDSSKSDEQKSLVINSSAQFLMFLEKNGFFDKIKGFNTKESCKMFYEELMKYLDKLNDFSDVPIDVKLNTYKDDMSLEQFYEDLKEVIEKHLFEKNKEEYLHEKNKEKYLHEENNKS